MSSPTDRGVTKIFLPASIVRELATLVLEGSVVLSPLAHEALRNELASVPLDRQCELHVMDDETLERMTAIRDERSGSEGST